MPLKNDYTNGEVLQAAEFNTLATTLNSAEQAANKGQPNGYAGLDGDGRVPSSQLPTTLVTTSGTQSLSNKTIVSPTVSDPALTGTAKVAQSGVFEVYNTADQTTNFEKAAIRYNSNVLEIGHFPAGTGSGRPLRIGGANLNASSLTRYIQINNSSLPYFNFISATDVSGTATSFSPNSIGSSVNQNAVAITPTYNQSGTASYTALLINPTENTTGSGTKRLIDAQVGGVSRFSVSNTGAVTSSGTFSVTANTFDSTQLATFSGNMFTQVVSNQAFFAITPTVNHTGLGGYRALRINVTESSTGSGMKRLIDAQVGGVSKFTVDNAGNVAAAGSITSLGGVVTDAPSGVDPLVVKVNGSTAWTVNQYGEFFGNAGTGVYYDGNVSTTAVSSTGSLWLTSGKGGSGDHDITIKPSGAGKINLTGEVSPDLTKTSSGGYLGVPANTQSANYTLISSDAGKMILHPSSDNVARTFTIPSNVSVPFPVGTVVTFVNGINTLTIAVSSDTMTLAGTSTTGSRTLAANGLATAVKTGSTTWLISGTGLS